MILSEIIQIILNTLLQSFLSAVFSLVLGLFGALGLLSISNIKLKKTLETLCLFTPFLPPLFLIVATFNIIQPFPFGLTGIVLLHTLSMVGFCSFIFSKTFSQKIIPFEKLSYIEGAETLLFLKNSLGYIRQDIISIFMYVFVVMLSSFSIPFIAGYEFPVFETLIFDILKTEGNLSKAFLLGFLEMVVIYFLLKIFSFRFTAEEKTSPAAILLKNKWCLGIVLVPLLIIVMGLIKGAAGGLTQLARMDWSLIDLKWMILKSVFIGMGTGFTFFTLFMLIGFFAQEGKYLKSLYRVMIPSTALIGVLMWMIFPFSFSKEIQIIIGFCFLFFISLYRLKFFDVLMSLRGQVQVGELMGSSRSLNFVWIVFPQIVDTALLLSGLGAFWAIGDFALSQMIYGNDSTLALFIQSLAVQYRVEAAAFLLFLLFFVGLVVYSFFRGLKYVFH